MWRQTEYITQSTCILHILRLYICRQTKICDSIHITTYKHKTYVYTLYIHIGIGSGEIPEEIAVLFRKQTYLKVDPIVQ